MIPMRHVIVASVFAFVALTGACSTNDAVVEPSCTLTPANDTMSVALGEQRFPRASVKCVGVRVTELQWTSADPSIATVDPGTGLLLALKPGITTLHATVAGFPTATASLLVSVGCPPVTLLAVTIAPQALTIPVNVSGVIRATTTRPASPPTCSIVVDTGFVFTSADTSVATVNSSGVVTGRRVGQTTVRAAVRENLNLSATAAITVTSIGGTISVTPTHWTLAPGDTFRLRASAPFGPNTPAGTDTTALFRSDNPCVATVSSDGLVTAQSIGSVDILALARRDPLLLARSSLTVFYNGPIYFTFESFTAGSPPIAIDPNAAKGTVTVKMNALPVVMPGGARVQLKFAGRSLPDIDIPAPPAGSTAPIPVTLTLQTDARDGSGARLYPNGPQGLEAILIPTPIPSRVPGCPLQLMQGEAIGASLTLVNP